MSCTRAKCNQGPGLASKGAGPRYEAKVSWVSWDANFLFRVLKILIAFLAPVGFAMLLSLEKFYGIWNFFSEIQNSKMGS